MLKSVTKTLTVRATLSYWMATFNGTPEEKDMPWDCCKSALKPTATPPTEKPTKLPLYGWLPDGSLVNTPSVPINTAKEGEMPTYPRFIAPIRPTGVGSLWSTYAIPAPAALMLTLKP